MNLKELAKEIIYCECFDNYTYNEIIDETEFKKTVEQTLKKAYDLGRQEATPKYSLSAHNMKSKFNLQGFK